MLAADLFNLPESLSAFAKSFAGSAKPWEWVGQIALALDGLDWKNLREQAKQNIPDAVAISGSVYIHPSAKIASFVSIEGPVWIGPNTEIRPGAYVRPNVIVGAGCVIGNSCELKNTLLLDNVQVPHFNYVGDSILGNRAHLGAGVVCANLRLDKKTVRVVLPNGMRMETQMKKLGVMMGDGAQAGCNTVFEPGAILGRDAIVVGGRFKGYLGAGEISRNQGPS